MKYQRLAETIEGFDMSRFEALLQTRTDQMEEELMEMLLSFVDFMVFKELILSKTNILKRPQKTLFGSSKKKGKRK